MKDDIERLKEKRKTKCISCILIQYIIFYLNSYEKQTNKKENIFAKTKS